MHLYAPVMALFVLAAGFAVFSVVVSSLTGPARYNRVKVDSYECGIEPTPHAVASMTTPRCTRRRFAMAKAATKMAIARSCDDIPGTFGVETYN